MAALKLHVLLLTLTLTLVVLVASEPGYRRGYGQGYRGPYHRPGPRHYANGPRSYSGALGGLWRPSYGGYRHGPSAYRNGAGFHRRDHGHRVLPAYGYGQGGNQYLASGSTLYNKRHNALAGHFNGRGFAYGHGAWRYGHGK